MEKRNYISKDFLLILIGQIISLFGNQILRFALPLYLLQKTGSSALFGTISACSFIPMIVLFPIGGIIADRANKRNIMVVLDFSTSALILGFSIMAKVFSIFPLIAITMILLFAIQGAYQPAVKASIPILVGKEYLMQANSAVDIVSSFANMFGPVIGGLFFSVFGLIPILYISVICFFVSAVMEIFIKIPFEKKRRNGNIFLTGLQDMGESFQFIFNQKPLLWKISITYGMVSMLLCSLFVIALPVLVTRNLGFSESLANRLYGYAEGVIAAGSILGGVLAGVLSKKLKAKTIPYLIIGCALSILTGGLALQLFHCSMAIYVVLVIGCSILMILSTLFQIQMMSYVQILTPSAMIGKVISCVICVCMCSNPIGQFLYGFVFEHIGDYSYLPFYFAAFIIICISVGTRNLFCKIDSEIINI